ncbi:MAG: LysR family transcriptional regulator [Holophaga sp.]|nr:LysR family transcriptional regulator [Holophaga sp.]
MDFKQLRALLTIADTGSVTRAAELLHIVQPAVSRQLRLLEEDVGTPLFERGRNRMELTESGRILVEYARRALHNLERARAEIAPVPGEVAGKVTVGMVPSLVNLLTSPVMAAVSARYPGIKLRFSTGGYSDLMQDRVEAGDVDMALMSEYKPSPRIQAEPLLEEKLWLIGLPSAGLRADHPVPVSELGGKPLILPSTFKGFRLLVEHACTLEGVHLTIAAETNSVHVQRCLVLGGQGLTILPIVTVADDVARGLLSAAPLTAPEVVRKILLAMPNASHIPQSVRCVASVITEEIRDTVLRGDWPAAQWLAVP